MKIQLFFTQPLLMGSPQNISETWQQSSVISSSSEVDGGLYNCQICQKYST